MRNVVGDDRLFREQGRVFCRWRKIGAGRACEVVSAHILQTLSERVSCVQTNWGF
jgi:hypothetical protein